MMKKRVDPMAPAWGLLFLIFAVFAFLYPYSGDDWTWGSAVGMERLSIFFANYNGRYLGNLLELAVTRSKLLDILAMAAAHTFCCRACWIYSPDRKPATALLAVVLFFLMPTSIYSQSVVWTAGFSNYVPSAMLSLAYMLVIRNITEREAPVYSRGTVPVVFAVGFCGALFMESITLFNICLAVAVIGYTALKFRRWYAAHVSFLAGAVLGAAAMFSNGAYRTIADGTDYYRTVADTAYEIVIYIVKHAKQILDYLIYENFLFCVILSLLVSVLLLEHRKTASGKAKGLNTLILAVNGICLAMIGLIRVYPTALHDIPCDLGLYPFLVDVFLIFVGFLYAADLAAAVLLCVPKDRRFRMLMPLCCVPVSMAPLLVVDPIGPRCVYAGYVFLMLFAADLFSYVISRSERGSRFHRPVTAVLCAAVVAQVLIFGWIFGQVHYWDARRNDYARVQSDRGDEVIYICQLPYEERLHDGSPVKDRLKERYLMFHGLDETATLEFVSRQELDAMIRAED